MTERRIIGMGVISITGLVVAFGSLCYAAQLEVDVRGAEGHEGRLAIGLYNGSEGFPEEGREFKGALAELTGTNVVYTFTNIPAGTYAVAAFHDANSNSKLDRNFLGLPKEGYGFSRGATGRLGPPVFEDAAVEVRADETVRTAVPLEY